MMMMSMMTARAQMTLVSTRMLMMMWKAMMSGLMMEKWVWRRRIVMMTM